MAEVRTIDPVTGGQKGVKEARFDLIPVPALTELAVLYGRGAKKYAERNMERGYPFSKSYAAMERHSKAWWNGEDHDPEMGTSHLAAVAWHAMTLMTLMSTHPEMDDRTRLPMIENLPSTYIPVQDLPVPSEAAAA